MFIKQIHLWVPSISESAGGIQLYSHFFLKALFNIYPHVTYHVFSKHDCKTTLNFQNYPKNIYFHLAGHLPTKLRTAAFTSQIASQAIHLRPDLIVSTHLNFLRVAHQLKKFARIPYWGIAHGIEAWNLPQSNLTAVQCADKILAVSSYTRDRLLQQFDFKQISILPNTFDQQRFQIGCKPDYLLQRYNIKADQPVILTVARLSSSEQYKGYDRILQALPQIRQVVPNVHYVLVGKGDDLPRIQKLIHELQLQSCVTLTGFVTDDELCDHYNLCDVFAMPSRGEGFGIVYLEALACGKPTIAGNKDGAVDALDRGKLGIFIEPDNVGKLAKTIVKVLQKHYNHPLIYQPELLRQHVINSFGFHQFINRIATYLNF